jgi:hypothetical protein
MPLRSSPHIVAIAFLAAAGMFACIWVFVAVGYWHQGIPPAMMLTLQLSRETPEWQASRWAIAFPHMALGLAAAYRWSTLAKSRLGASLLAAVATCVWAAGINLVHPMLVFATAIPVVLACHFVVTIGTSATNATPRGNL